MSVTSRGLGGSITAPKLASVVARRIEDEVAAQGWPVGEVLGSETDLVEHFGVSRAVLREAVRIVEHTGAARMRRGPGGGLVVSQPDRRAVVTAMGVWFSYAGVTIGEMLEVRRPLITAAVRLAADRRSEGDAVALTAHLDTMVREGAVTPGDLAELEAMVVAIAGSPPLALFVESLAELGVSRLATGRAGFDPPLTDATLLAHLEAYRPVVAAIGAGNGAAAANQMGALVDAVDRRLGEMAAPRPSGTPGPAQGKLAEQVVAALVDDIERAGWPVGEVIGSESELIERYGVSRAILREAVRIVEHHGAVRTKRGPRGGLVVTAPDSGAIVRAARMILEFEGVTADQLLETRSVLEVAAVRLAAGRVGPDVVDELGSALADERAVGDAVLHFMPVHHHLAAASGNPLFELFIDVMGELVPSHVKAAHRTADGLADLSSAVQTAHASIVDAVVAGDADAAERRMRRHLEASAEVLE